MMKHLFSICLILLFCSCGQNSESEEDGGVVCSPSFFEEEEVSQEQMAANISIYQGWFQFAQAFSQMSLNNSKYMIQSQQQLIANNRQMAQSVGMPVNQQLEYSMVQSLQQAQMQYQNFTFIYNIVQEQGRILQGLNQNSTNYEQLFNQATAFNAVILYMIFGKGQMQNFQQLLQPALNWYFSPQCDIDIKNGIEYLRSINQAMALNRMNNTASGSSVFNNERHRTRLSDAILNLKSWVDPTNGDVYKFRIDIEQPYINGNEMKGF